MYPLLHDVMKGMTKAKSKMEEEERAKSKMEEEEERALAKYYAIIDGPMRRIVTTEEERKEIVRGMTWRS